MSQIRQWTETAEESESLATIMDCASQLYRAGVFSAAMRYFRRAQELDSDALQNAAIDCTPEEASQMMAQRAVFQQVLTALDEAYQARNRTKLDEAIAIVEELLALAPNDPTLLNDHGLFHAEKYAMVANVRNPSTEHRQLLEIAEQQLTRALELDPYLPTAHNNLGLVYGYIDKLKEAAACFLRALELQPDYSEAQKNLSMLREMVGSDLDE